MPLGELLLPAPAGLVPCRWDRGYHSESAPCVRGVGPKPLAQGLLTGNCSPRPQGWTHGAHARRRPRRLLPAPAGMDPSASGSVPPRSAAPRARGVGPRHRSSSSIPVSCSPRPRGWSPALRGRPRIPALLPAPAGMDPVVTSETLGNHPAPRARGDGPEEERRSFSEIDCSPRLRGWTLLDPHARGARGLLPAPAGLVPPPSRGVPPGIPAPRARRVGPASANSSSAYGPCSPRPRGWTLTRR